MIKGNYGSPTSTKNQAGDGFQHWIAPTNIGESTPTSNVQKGLNDRFRVVKGAWPSNKNYVLFFGHWWEFDVSYFLTSLLSRYFSFCLTKTQHLLWRIQKNSDVMGFSEVPPSGSTFPSRNSPLCWCTCRCADAAGGAAALSGAADGDASPAASGPAGLLQEESRDWNGIFQKPGEAGRAVHGQNSQHQGPSAIQVGSPVSLLLYHFYGGNAVNCCVSSQC